MIGQLTLVVQCFRVRPMARGVGHKVGRVSMCIGICVIFFIVHPPSIRHEMIEGSGCLSLKNPIH